VKVANPQAFGGDRRRCEKTNAAGQRCRAPAMDGSRFCFFHNPASKDVRLAAQRRGGQANRAAVLPRNSEDLALTSAKDVAALLATTINQVRKGLISPKIATAIGYLAGSLTRALEASNMDARLSRLEQASGTGPAPGLFDADSEPDGSRK